MSKGEVLLTGNIRTIPRLRTIRNVGRFLKNPIPLIDETMKEMGSTYLTYIGATQRTIMTQEPAFIRHVLQKNHKNYYKSSLQTKNLAKYIGEGLLTTNGKYWLRQRRLIQPGFHKEKLNSIVGIMNRQIIESCDNIQKRIESGVEEFDLSQEMMAMALRIVSKSLFSTGVSEEDLRSLGTIIHDLQHAIVKEVRQPMFNWWRAISGEDKKNLGKAEDARKLIMKIITARQNSGDNFDDLLDMLLASRYEDTGEPMSMDQLLNEVLIVFVAGHETTANALTWAFYNIEQNPEVLQKLLEEYRLFPAESPDFTNLRSLSYTTQVLSESMRTHPPVWITDRVALGDDQIGEYTIKKGDRLGLYIYGTHMSDDLWDAPSTFDPERFAPEVVKKITPFAYFPFGGGPRLCIGQQFSMMEMQLALFHFIKRFDYSLVENHPVEIEPLVTLRPRHGMKMRVVKR